MNTKARYVLILTLVLLVGAVLWATFTLAAPGDASLASGAPTVVAYQGEVRVSGVPFTGNGYFKFAVVNTAGNASYWSNDGTSTGGGVPTASVQLVVSDGLFSVLLGDTALGGMTQALSAAVFSQPDRYLRVWFSTSSGGAFSQLTPDTRIAAVPYALQAQEAADADMVDGLHASQLGTHYQNVVIVAKSGGDHNSVQAAIDSVTDAVADNPYLVWVAPGIYSETVTMKPYVHLQGAGQEATVITSTASSSGDWPPTQATLVLASDTSLRDLTVGNSGAGVHKTALLATAGMTRTLVADVTARALGGGENTYAIYLSGSGTDVTLQQVTALGENGSGANFGLVNQDGATAVLIGGNYTGRGGTYAWGIYNVLTATMKAENVTALGENGTNLNHGIQNTSGATAVLFDGDFTGRGGIQTGGVGNTNNSTLTAEGVTALAENGSGDNYGMGNYNVATATLHGGVFTARGGTNNYALSNELTVTMKAENVTALAENGSNDNYGLWNVNNATLVLHGASLTGRGGINAYGIDNHGSGTTLEAESVTALGENGSNDNYGLDNKNGAVATLRGGAFTARAGTTARGISNSDSGSILEAESITVLAENGDSGNQGLYNFSGAETTLHGCSFTARGGTNVMGILNSGNGATLEAESVTALGEDGSSSNYGLYNNSGEVTLRGGAFTGRGGTIVGARGISNTGSGAMLEAESVTALGEDASNYNYGLFNSFTANVTQSVLEGTTNSVKLSLGTVSVSNSRLVGGAVSGTVTCVLVTRGTTISTDGVTCP